jgi:site-specific DNA-methyltransferase (adenine-specific)
MMMMMETTLLLGDCLDRLRELPDSSVHACVTDPPYGLSFMCKRWDTSVPGVEVWREVLRVLKPGGHLLAFFGTRTYHRGVVAIEDAGFEIRDQIGWAFGSGFPKSLDVSKAIDKAAGVEREVVGVNENSRPAKRKGGAGFDAAVGGEALGDMPITAPATPEAQTWQGWGTALKPAWEPIVVARKPLDGTVAANVLEHGTGGINVDGCRVGTGDDRVSGGPTGKRIDATDGYSSGWGFAIDGTERATGGRWPANLIHDGSEEVLELFPDTAPSSARPRNNGDFKSPSKGAEKAHVTYGHNDNGGSAARFFYCAKASKRDREEGLEDAEPVRSSDRVADDLPGGDNPRNRSNHARVNHHPTVKPTDLMRYLCRLVTPPGGVVLDPFMGSGSTGKAAILEGFRFVGIEREAEYHAIAEARIRHVMPEPPQQPAAPAPVGQLTLW